MALTNQQLGAQGVDESHPRLANALLFAEVRVVRVDSTWQSPILKQVTFHHQLAFWVGQRTPAFFHAGRPKSGHRRVLRVLLAPVSRCGEPCLAPQIVGSVSPLPGELGLFATEMTIGRGLAVNRA